MREFDAPAKILSEDMEVHGEILAHPPRSPNLLMKAFIQKADPFKPQLKPWDFPRHNWRKNAREDYYFKAAVLLATMAFDGKDGHRPLTDAKAVGLWHDLLTGKKNAVRTLSFGFGNAETADSNKTLGRRLENAGPRLENAGQTRLI